MTWTALIWIYLWLAGMAGGAFLAAKAVGRFSGSKDDSLLRLATWLGLPLAILGVLLLIFELGTPLWFWHLFTQFDFTSPMSMGTWILIVWVILGVTMLATWWLEGKVSQEAAASLASLRKLISRINIFFSAALIAYTGVLLAVSSQSLWAGTILLPALFVVSAVSTGVAALVLAALGLNAIADSGMAEIKLAINQIFGSTEWKTPKEMIVRLAEADAAVIVLEIAVMIGYVIWLATSTAGSDALGVITTGSMAAPFWVGVVLLALLIPFGLDLTIRNKAAEAKGVMMTIVTSSLCVIVGGLILRWVITSGGQL
ncbi:MAG TPA: polysulfide reductase NrfD [Dehalococcoidia bacterium]|nr:polysulfide reductase NrfD [Dehalococcoidia bacterium]